MSRIHASLVFAAALLLSSTLALAANPSPLVRSDHPGRYTVVKGDTLWDISGRFLREPWLWPEVWRANPHIKNPHLIYPGDEVFLSYRDGRPIISVRRKRPGYVKLSPSVRSTSLANEAIPTIPVDAVNQFLRRPRVVTELEFDAAPYILSVGAEALLARPGQKVYVRGLDEASDVRYAVYRRGKAYQDPAQPEEILGYEAVHVADAALDVAGDPATLVLTKTYREVMVGDRLVPVDAGGRYDAYMPRPADPEKNGTIISVVDGVTQIGQYQTVVLNLGERDGMAPGVVFAVYQRGAEVEDPLATDPLEIELERRKKERQDELQNDTAYAFVQGFGHAVEATSDFIEREARGFELAATNNRPWAEVTLPDERAGTVMVYRTFDRVSYALVMEATRAMHVLDRVRNP
jgi:hypothetical protein